VRRDGGGMEEEAVAREREVDSTGCPIYVYIPV